MNFGDFTPHGFCLAWDPALIWLQAGSDLAIAVAYYSIPAALLVFLRRRTDLAFRSVFGLFAAFILACGTTHVLGVITLWQPIYWLDGEIKALTAALSVATAIMLWALLPKALSLPSPTALRRVNAELARQVRERDEAVMSLHASEERLRHAHKMEAVGQLTGGIAHDFNNLLTTIMGSLEMLERRPGLDERGQRLAGNALEGARRAARLTSQLLSFSRRQRLSAEPLDMTDVIGGVRDLLERTLGERISLTVIPPEAAQWPAMADRNQLEIALLNLAINGRDAIAQTQAGEGTVSISFANEALTQADTTRLSPDPMAPGQYVRITVADTGCGMTPEVLEHAFEPFFTTKPVGTGTGLGLAQIYGFATQSGGAVHIASAQGEGTRVNIYLPRAIAAAPCPAPSKTPPATLPGHGETILVAEDDPLLRHTVTVALEVHGYTVASAPHGDAALAMLQGGLVVDILFTDVMMPGSLNGVALAQAARLLRPALKIIFATGYSDRRVLEKWTEELDLLHKPYSVHDMTAHIAGRLDREGLLPTTPLSPETSC
jgi:signal transduction histidine kinase/ActR/RegA family two-component response regulator